VSQIALPLDAVSSAKDNSYIVTDANAEAHYYLQNWQSWPNLTAILVGDPSSGKSAMARKFEHDSGGYIADDAELVADTDLFHLWNRAKEERKPLLFVSGKPISEWNVELPDLKSRLAASLLIEINSPDEAMIEGLLQQYFSLRGLSVSKEAILYLNKRMERSYRNIQLLAQKMDNLAIERKKPINRGIAMEALSQHQMMAEQQNSGSAAPQNIEEG
jgi:hypothetical protein